MRRVVEPPSEQRVGPRSAKGQRPVGNARYEKRIRDAAFDLINDAPVFPDFATQQHSDDDDREDERADYRQRH